MDKSLNYAKQLVISYVYADNYIYRRILTNTPLYKSTYMLKQISFIIGIILFLYSLTHLVRTNTINELLSIVFIAIAIIYLISLFLEIYFTKQYLIEKKDYLDYQRQDELFKYEMIKNIHEDKDFKFYELAEYSKQGIIINDYLIKLDKIIKAEFFKSYLFITTTNFVLALDISNENVNDLIKVINNGSLTNVVEVDFEILDDEDILYFLQNKKIFPVPVLRILLRSTIVLSLIICFILWFIK